MSFRNVLIAIDDRPIATHAVEVGAEMTFALGAELALVHVIEWAGLVARDHGGGT